MSVMSGRETVSVWWKDQITVQDKKLSMRKDLVKCGELSVEGNE